MDATSPEQTDRVREEFDSLVSGRVLPIDTIWKVVVLGHGALWKHRMIRDMGQNKKSDAILTAASSAAIESRILIHIFSLHITLLKIGLVELAESPPEDAAEGDLAQRITATFRRTLPALRIAGKWLSANFKYVLRAQEAVGKERDTLWATYSRFSSVLSNVFPIERLPPMTTPLDEDIEMRGFLPLGRMMFGETKCIATENEKGDDGSKAPAGQGLVHPNEEQLMRIADLLDDAKALMAMENSPVVLTDPHLAIADSESTSAPGPNPSTAFSNNRREVETDEDAMTETTSRTDDDPVGDAFRKALNGSDGEGDDDEVQEDEIVWNPK
jgi:protein SMG7